MSTVQPNARAITLQDLLIYVIDDDIALCGSLRWLLESAGLSVATFTSAAAFLTQYKAMPSNKPSCLLLDVRMPGMSGFELQEQLSRQHHLPIIMMTGHGDIPMAVRAMKAGAIDFITKPFNDQLLLDLLQKVVVEVINKPAVLALHRTPEIKPELIKCYASLTAREREIMLQVVNGKLNKQIAYNLGIAMKTVELHRAHVMQKMQVRSLADLVKAAIQLELA